MSDFEELVHRYEGRIFRFAANSLRNPADAQEVTQDTFVTAYRNLARFDGRRPFATWLFTIARRKCIDRHRTARPQASQEFPEQPDLNDPAELLSQREAEQDLWNLARRALPDLQFHALWLRYAEDMSIETIARVLCRTKVHVKVLLFRARTRLVRELKQERKRDEPGRTLEQFQPALATGEKAGK